MAVQEHFEGFDQEPDELSRSAHKREAQKIRKLAEDLSNLGKQSFDALTFPDEEVREALILARSMKRNSDERRRQLQYAAKLMRNHELDELIGQVKMQGSAAKADPQAQRLENLRENLIHGGVKALNEYCAAVRDADRNKLRTLIKRAHDELSSGLPDRPAARALYQYLKSEQKRTQAPLPVTLTAKR